jgi:hypothetical protein
VAVADQVLTDRYALYLGDACEVLPTLGAGSVDFSVYSPPFAGLFHYSSSERDLSNCRTYEEFLAHYGFVVREIARLTKPGRCSAVHVMDVPSSNTGKDWLVDFPGDVIRLHERCGFRYVARHAIWKEPLEVRNRTLKKDLAHRTVVDDSAYCGVAGADYLLIFRRDGVNRVPIAHPVGLTDYAGATPVPPELAPYRGWRGDQKLNRYSHWIWRRYASSIWDDVRLDRVLPYREARDPEDEKHMHPLQLDVIERAIVLRSNPGETVLTPVMGVGSEVYEAVRLGRRAIGVELKPSYYRQAVKNVERAAAPEESTLPLAFDAAAGLDDEAGE